MMTQNNNFTDIGALILRVSLGAMWLSHAMLKWSVFTIPGFAAWLESQGLPASMAWPVFLLEVLGGVCITLGIYGRYVSFLLLPILFGASWIHSINGWVHTNPGGGWEYPAFLVAASITHTFIGDGRFAIRSNESLMPRMFS
jgi:putative oxidoreductase